MTSVQGKHCTDHSMRAINCLCEGEDCGADSNLKGKEAVRLRGPKREATTAKAERKLALIRPTTASQKLRQSFFLSLVKWET